MRASCSVTAAHESSTSFQLQRRLLNSRNRTNNELLTANDNVRAGGARRRPASAKATAARRSFSQGGSGVGNGGPRRATPPGGPGDEGPRKSMIRVYIDGGARGNPGPAGYGVRIEDADGTLIDELYDGLGITTNNVAEYNGLLAALKWAIDHGHQQVQVRADSELLVKQMRGEYRVKHPGLQPLAARARLLIGQLDDVTFQHVRREENKEADRLSNLGMDQAEAALREKPQGPDRSRLF